MRKKWIAMLLCIAMTLTLLAGCGSSSSSTAASGSVAGTYEGTGKGRNGVIVVAVTLDDNAAITNIEVKEQQETAGVGDVAFDQMIPQMVENNTIAVDAVASATLTSNGLLEAVRAALTSESPRRTGRRDNNLPGIPEGCRHPPGRQDFSIR